MNGHFTQHAIKAIEAAQFVAQELEASFIGTHHLLLGMMKTAGCRAAMALEFLGLDFDMIKKTVERLDANEESSLATNPYYTPVAKEVMEYSVHEAKRFQSNYIGTEHILLSIVAQQSCVALTVFEELGINPRMVMAALSETAPASEPPPMPTLSPPGTMNVPMLGSEATKGYPHSRDRSRRGGPMTPHIDRFGLDLTYAAKQDELDPVIGRENEIGRAIQILARRTKNNPVLIGEPGVGKTAVAEGLAARIANDNVPPVLRGKRLVSLSLTAMVAGAKYRGEFEERLRMVIKEAQRARNVILFIDELHTLIGAGSAEGSLDAANIMKPALARGDIQVIGATTHSEYKKHFEKDAALARRFQTVMVEEPDEETTLSILTGLRSKYEEFHRATIKDEALSAAVRLSHRYINDRFLPDKAIDLVDEAAAKVRVNNIPHVPEMKRYEKRLSRYEKEKDEAIKAQDYEKAAKLRDSLIDIKTEINLKIARADAKNGKDITVTARDVADVVAMWTGIPVRDIEAQESERLLQLEKIIARRLVGQEKAVNATAKAVRRARAGLKDPRRPIGSFLFLGPTGVGKTELAKALAEAMFGSDEAVIRLDMSEYMDKYTASKMVGAPPGYVGYDEGGQLTDAVRRKPYSIILLDEIEKAHPDIFNMLLQILDDGRLTDSKGRTVNFKNTVIIMTSNAGASFLKKTSSVGFAAADKSASEEEAAQNRVMEEVKRLFKPEFLNRIDEMVVFSPLGKTELTKIVDIMLRDIRRRLSEKELKLELSPAAKARLIEEGSDFKFGARPLKRAIQKLLEDEIAERLLAKEFTAGDTIYVKKTGDKLDFTKKALHSSTANKKAVMVTPS